MKKLLILLLLSSCSHLKVITNDSDQGIKINSPIHRIIKDEEPSFDGNEQNSGIIDFNKDKGWQVTERAANRYNLLISKYGNTFEPPIQKDFGISKDKDKIFISNEGMVKFAMLTQKQKSNL